MLSLLLSDKNKDRLAAVLDNRFMSDVRLMSDVQTAAAFRFLR
jgi:hypothetical protein